MAFGIPKLGDLTAQLNTRFEEMMVELRDMRSLLRQILAELQKGNTNA